VLTAEPVMTLIGERQGERWRAAALLAEAMETLEEAPTLTHLP
jgi:hypothetical protein